MKPAICIVIAFLLLPGLVWANLSQSLEGADSLEVGDAFSLTIKTDYPISTVSIPDTLRNFAVTGSSATGVDKRSWKLKLVPLGTGALSFPRLQVIPQDSGREAEYTDGFRVYVLSVLAEGDTLLRDIKPLEKYPLQLPFWVYALLLLIAIGLAFYLLLKRKSKPVEHQTELVPVSREIHVPAWQEAMSWLEKLLAQGLLEREAWLPLYFGLSDILRGFLEKEYSFNAREMTVSEISEVLQRSETKNSAEVLNYLQLCDMVKFAKHEPDMDSTSQRIQWLQAYLKSFKAIPAGVNHA